MGVCVYMLSRAKGPQERRKGGCCGIIHTASMLKGKLWTAAHRKCVPRKHTHAYTQIRRDNPGPLRRDPGICCPSHSCEELSPGPRGRLRCPLDANGQL